MAAANPVKTCSGCDDAELRRDLPVENQCNSCRKKERNRIWRQENPGAMAANAKRWRDAGNTSARPEGYAEQQLARDRERYRTDPEVRQKALERSARYREQNPEKVKLALKAWVSKNREKVRTYGREYARAFGATPEGRKRQAAMRQKFKTQRAAQQAGYNAKRYGEHGILDAQFLFWLHKWQDHCCAYCNTDLAGRHTVEHIVPLNKGGTNLPHNTVLACPSCNSSKQDRLIDVWSPPHIAQPLRCHSVDGTASVLALLRDGGMEVEPTQDRLILPNGRHLFVLSSFWTAERLRPPLMTIQVLAAHNPGAIFTFDFEWRSRQEAMLNVVRAKAGMADDSAGARKMTVDTPTVDEAKAFMNRWHLQGFASGSLYRGLRESNGTWRAMGSVSVSSKGLAMLGRLAFQGHVPGGFSRLVKAIAKSVTQASTLVTYADSRLSSGEGYGGIGFVAQGDTVPSFHYANAVGLHHWNAYTKASMARKVDFYDDDWGAWRLARTNGLWRVDDLPLHRFAMPIQA